MTLHRIDVGAVAPQSWRNGGGQTRELWRWPEQGPWQLRISRADIDRDGPFSAFVGVQRWFAVLSGAGVELQFGTTRRTLRPGDEALHFDGALAPGCRLLDGPTQDLNLMTSAGTAHMERIEPGSPWTSSHAMRGLYTTLAGHWHCEGQERSAGPLPSKLAPQCAARRWPDERQAVAAHSLLWDDAADPQPWRFDVDAAGVRRGQAIGYWLAFTPAP